MTQLNSTSLKGILQETQEKDEYFIKELVRRLLQELMEKERNEQV